MLNNEKKFERLLEDMLDEIAGYPDAMMKEHMEGNPESDPSRQSRQTLSALRESVENMRICVKYLFFDLDATRRESLYFKKLLEEKDR